MLQRERCLQITLTLTFQQHVRFYCYFSVADESTDSIADDSQESSTLDDSTAQESPTKNDQVSLYI